MVLVLHICTHVMLIGFKNILQRSVIYRETTFCPLSLSIFIYIQCRRRPNRRIQSFLFLQQYFSRFLTKKWGIICYIHAWFLLFYIACILDLWCPIYPKHFAFVFQSNFDLSHQRYNTQIPYFALELKYKTPHQNQTLTPCLSLNFLRNLNAWDTLSCLQVFWDSFWLVSLWFSASSTWITELCLHGFHFQPSQTGFCLKGPVRTKGLSFLDKRVTVVTYLKVIGCGMKTILCISQKIADFWMMDFGALRMGDLICVTPSGDGNPKTATYPGSY